MCALTFRKVFLFFLFFFLCETAAFDPELHSVLVLASDAELYELSNILYGQRSTSLFSFGRSFFSSSFLLDSLVGRLLALVKQLSVHL